LISGVAWCLDHRKGEKPSSGYKREAKVEAVGALPLLLHGGFTLNLNNVLYVPLLRRNLISVASLEDDGYECLFRNNKYHIKFNEVIIDLAPR
jgi:hypothetical protein